MEVVDLIWLVIASPLIGAVLNGFILPKNNKALSHIVGVVAVGVSFLCALPLFLKTIQGSTPGIQYGYSWLQVATLNIGLELIVDSASTLMLMIITGIGFLIHVYSGGYMAEEKSTSRFFSYLNLFVFMMLLLVLGNNLLVMFVGWEGVGLCSYLLIGYWFEKRENAAAGMKAFVVNRVGDFGFLIGIFLTYRSFGTLSFSELAGFLDEQVVLSSEQLTTLTAIGLCFFVGACGKSAQIPLYIWLPDAMAGPTPVSALIHAATMVTAGVYMMARLHFLYYLSPFTMTTIAWVGAITAIFAATIAVVQTDIKKVLAYSTVSQLGYMVLAAGVGAFDASIFHLLTHACFKALLFLGAGSVIVAMHHKQDMVEMGGLARYLPITHKVFVVGVLAIIGFPGFAGFFSKDEILWRAFIFPNGGFILWLIGMLTAALTAFYMVRLLCLTFYGPNRSDEHTRQHLKETPSVMWIPLVVLALLSTFVGYIGLPPVIGHVFGVPNYLASFLGTAISMPKNASQFWDFISAPHSVLLEWVLMGISTVIALLSAGVAFGLYRRGPSPLLSDLSERSNRIYSLLLNKYWVDEAYQRIVVTPLREIAEFLWKIVDVRLINGFINFIGHLLLFIGGLISFQMSGNLQRYLILFVMGFVGLLYIAVAI